MEADLWNELEALTGAAQLSARAAWIAAALAGVSAIVAVLAYYHSLPH